MTIKIPREVEPKEVAYMVFGTGALGYPWWGRVDWLHIEDGEIFPIEERDQLDIAEEEDVLDIRHDARDDAEGDMTGKMLVSFPDIVKAFSRALRDGHIYERDAITEDLGLLDAEQADIVLQYAVFGEIIYG